MATTIIGAERSKMRSLIEVALQVTSEKCTHTSTPLQRFVAPLNPEYLCQQLIYQCRALPSIAILLPLYEVLQNLEFWLAAA